MLSKKQALRTASAEMRPSTSLSAGSLMGLSLSNAASCSGFLANVRVSHSLMLPGQVLRRHEPGGRQRHLTAVPSCCILCPGVTVKPLPAPLARGRSSIPQSLGLFPDVASNKQKHAPAAYDWLARSIVQHFQDVCVQPRTSAKQELQVTGVDYQYLEVVNFWVLQCLLDCFRDSSGAALAPRQLSR